MARVTGPLMSLDASGSIADTIVFSKWKGRNYVRQHAIPSNPRSAGQYFTRAMMSFLAKQWAGLAGADQTAWTTLAAATNISLFNAYVKFNMDKWTQEDGPLKTPTEASAVASALGVLAATGGKGILTLSQAVTTANAGWGCLFMIRNASSPAGALQYVRLGRPVDGTNAITGVIRDLAAGTWFAQGVSFSDGGQYGTASTAVSDTVT